jgi:hypothetical protein
LQILNVDAGYVGSVACIGQPFRVRWLTFGNRDVDASDQ